MKIVQKLAVVLLAVAVAFGGFHCGRNAVSEIEIISNTRDTLYQATVEHRVDTFYKYEVRVLESQVIVPGVVDTAAILKNHFTNRVLLREFEKPDLTISITDTLYQNDIIGTALHYNLLIRDTNIVINNKVVFERKKARLYAGLNLSLTSRVDLTPELFLVPRNQKSIYGLGYSPREGVFRFHFLRNFNAPRLFRSPKLIPVKGE